MPNNEAAAPNTDEIARVVSYIAEQAAQFALQAGVGGMETAGAFVSFLAGNPERIPQFMNGSVLDLTTKLHVEGCLSWHGMDGKLHWPNDIRKMEGRHEH